MSWLISRAESAGPTGYAEFMASVDTVAIGRSTYEMVLRFGEEQWPYEGKRVVVLSTRMQPGADRRIVLSRNLDELTRTLIDSAATRVNVDGGQVIRSFLRARLLDDITITVAPVLLGAGLPLFGPLDRDISLTHRSTTVLGAGFVQSVYTVVTAEQPGG